MDQLSPVGQGGSERPQEERIQTEQISETPSEVPQEISEPEVAKEPEKVIKTSSEEKVEEKVSKSAKEEPPGELEIGDLSTGVYTVDQASDLTKAIDQSYQES